jgi:hypothetical protein
MSSREALDAALAPLCATVAGLDLTDADGSTAALNQAHPLHSLEGVRQLLFAGRAEGWITPQQAGPTCLFGRVAKPSDATSQMSIDAVDMEGEGGEHTHPKGEVSLCYALTGEPTFDGHGPGWVVLPAGSHHTPTIRDGRMLIIYFLPDGAVAWGPKA